MKNVYCSAFVGTITSSPSVFLMKVRADDPLTHGDWSREFLNKPECRDACQLCTHDNHKVFINFKNNKGI